MGVKKNQWACERIIKKLHAISDLELEQRLAELWEVLVQNKGQFHRSQVLVPVKSQSPLLPIKRSKR